MKTSQPIFKIEHIDVKSLRLNDKNPRIIKDINFERLVRSIKEFPQMLEIRPIVVDKSGMILGGSQRFAACKHLKYKTVPIIRAEKLTQKQQQEFIALDNVSFGDWDMEKLKANWDIKQLDGWGLIPQKKIVEFDVKAPDQKWYLNIEFTNEAEIQEYYDRFKKEGLTVKIVQ